MANFNTSTEYITNLISGSGTGAPNYPEQVLRTIDEHPKLDDKMAILIVNYSGSHHEVIMDLKLIDDKKFQIGNFVNEELTYGWTEKGYQDEVDALNMLRNIAVS